MWQFPDIWEFFNLIKISFPASGWFEIQAVRERDYSSLDKANFLKT